MTTLDFVSPSQRLDRGAKLHYGSFSFASAAQPALDAAFAYLSRDEVARSLIDRLESAHTPHRLVIDQADDDSYDPNTHTIRWDPHSAMLTTGGGRQSPALGLAHEIDHAVEPLGTEVRLQNISDPAYDNAEERRVITGSEAHEARTLHEGLRHDHDGVSYRVPSPIMRRVGSAASAG